MGWWTLGGAPGAPLLERCKGELRPELRERVTREELRSGYGERVAHLLVEDDGRTHWVVMLLQGGMVKVLDEDMGPYCAPCSPEFFAAAVAACPEPHPASFAAAFRKRMAGDAGAAALEELRAR